MRKIVLDTNCLLMALPKRSPYRLVWDCFLAGRLVLCFSNDVLEEYEEVLALKTSPSVAANVVSALLDRPDRIQFTVPYYHFTS